MTTPSAVDKIIAAFRESRTLVVDDTQNTFSIPQDYFKALTSISKEIRSHQVDNLEISTVFLQDMVKRMDDLLSSLEIPSGNIISSSTYNFLQQALSIIVLLYDLRLTSQNIGQIVQIYNKLSDITAFSSLNSTNISDVISGLNGKLTKTDANADDALNKIIKQIKKVTTTSFSDIQGLEEEKLFIESLIFQNKNNISEKSPFICLSGPPGTGKSSIANAIATSHSDGVFYNFSVSDLSTSTFGETESAIREFFKQARASQVNITIVLDEFDTLFNSSHSFNKTIANQLQTIISDGGDPLPMNIFIIALTNYYDEIPEPMKRRMTAARFIDIPETENMVNYLVNNILPRNINNGNVSENMMTHIRQLINNPRKKFTYANMNNIIDNVRNSVVMDIQKNRQAGMINSDYAASVNDFSSSILSNTQRAIPTYIEHMKNKRFLYLPRFSEIENAFNFTTAMTNAQYKEFVEKNSNI